MRPTLPTLTLLMVLFPAPAASDPIEDAEEAASGLFQHMVDTVNTVLREDAAEWSAYINATQEWLLEPQDDPPPPPVSLNRICVVISPGCSVCVGDFDPGVFGHLGVHHNLQRKEVQVLYPSARVDGNQTQAGTARSTITADPSRPKICL